MGDGAAEDTKINMEKFLKKLDALINAEVPNFTLILDDPAGNSYLQVSKTCMENVNLSYMKVTVIYLIVPSATLLTVRLI